MSKLRVALVSGAALVAAWVPPAAATPPGSNGQIAFASLRDGNEEIYVMDADGSPETNLTTDPARDYDPSWSPDGTKIAFTSERDGDPNTYVMDADGTDVLQLTDDPASDYDPTWSPDGSKILFTSQRDGDFELFVMYPDGSDETQV
jgi:Tol biopolymer transport system component